jgi:hypothetical protein
MVRLDDGMAFESDARLLARAEGGMRGGGGGDGGGGGARGTPDEISDTDNVVGGGAWKSPRRGEFERSMQSGLSFRVLALILTKVLLLRHSGRTDDGTFSLQFPANDATAAGLQDGSQQQNKSQLSLVKSQVQLPNEGNCVPSRETWAVEAEELL